MSAVRRRSQPTSTDDEGERQTLHRKHQRQTLQEINKAERVEFTIGYREQVHMGVRRFAKGGDSKHWRQGIGAQLAPGKTQS